MRLYKYRDLRRPDETCLDYLAQILVHEAFWAARPDTLNDPTEFKWACDFTPTPRTKQLLANVLHRTNTRSAADALFLAHRAIEDNRLEAYAAPVVALMQARCRDEIGLVCFGTSADSKVLWQRYGGDGVGVCIEFEAAPHLLGSQLRPVTYATTKTLHIDQVLAATLDEQAASMVYEAALLTKPAHWHEEAEVRFISKQQGVSVKLSASPLLRVTFGPNLPADTAHKVAGIVANLPRPLEMRYAEA